MDGRKRINLSVEPKTYESLQRLSKSCGFKNVCQLVESFVSIMLDRVEGRKSPLYNLTDMEEDYINEMFGELSDVQENLTADTPQRRVTKRLK